MNVRELMAELEKADPEAVVLFRAIGADETESDAVDEVRVPVEPWMYEKGDGYECYYSGEPEPRGEAHGTVSYERVSVVVLRPYMPEEWKDPRDR